MQGRGYLKPSFNDIAGHWAYDTIENVLEKSKESELEPNNHTKSIIYNDEPLTRGDAVRLCRTALTAKMPAGGML